jgi:hypothetical protein
MGLNYQACGIRAVSPCDKSHGAHVPFTADYTVHRMIILQNNHEILFTTIG